MEAMLAGEVVPRDRQFAARAQLGSHSILR
jgi:hypothetical protein